MNYTEINLKDSKIVSKTLSNLVSLDSGNIEHLQYLYRNYKNCIEHPVLASTKTRGAVSGGGAKPYKQKGTGRARRGTNRTPLRVGGSVIFGPSPRLRSFKVNKKVRQIVLRSLFNSENEKIVLTSGDSTVKSSSVLKMLADCGVDSTKKILTIVESPLDPSVVCVRNLKNNKLIPVSSISFDDFFTSDIVIFSENSFENLVKKVTENG